jgi:Rieske Fe-S protein
MSREDQPVDRPLGDYQDGAGMLPSPPTVQNGAGSAPATQPDAPTELFPTNAAFLSPAEGYPDSLGGIDPFVWWAETSGKPLNSPPTPESSTRRPPVRLAKSDRRSPPRPAQQDRRKFVKLLAVGAAGIVTVVTVGGISFARAPQSTTQSPSRIDDDRSEESTSIDAHRERDDDWGEGRRGRRPHKKPTPSQSPTPRPSPSPTQTQTPQPTPTGTVIGSTSQATNSAVSFTNPADGQGSLLIHMSNGNFVACERACTHQGVPVNYDPGSGRLVCPAHGAIFDPLHGFTHLSGPGNGPLASVSIHVNANGTINTP